MNDVSSLLGQSLRDRQQVLDSIKGPDARVHHWQDVPLYQQVLNLRNVWELFDGWVSESAKNRQETELCRRFEITISKIRQSMLVFWEAATIIQLYKNTVELAVFADVRLTQSLKSDMGPISADSNAMPMPSTGIVGALVPSPSGHGIHDIVGFKQSRSLMSVSTPFAEMKMCRALADHHRHSHVESKFILSISPLTSQSEASDGSQPPQSHSGAKAAFFDRITLMFERNIGGSSDLDGRDQLLKCVWFDTVLTRWSSSGCATHLLIDTIRVNDFKNDGERFVLCECNHRTEFGLVMYSTHAEKAASNINSNTADGITASGVSYIQHIAMICVLSSLQLLTLVNAYYCSNRVVAVNYSVKAVKNIIILNSLLMLSTTITLALALAGLFFGFQYTASHQWVVFIAPVLIGLRFSLNSFFTTLVMTPLLRLKNMAGKSKQILVHSKEIMMLCCIALAMTVILLGFQQRYVLTSVAIGLVSLFVAVIYMTIAYRCYSALNSSFRRGNTTESSINNTGSYQWIGPFLLTLSAIYGVAHVCQAGIYLTSALASTWYSTNINLLQTAFKWVDILSLIASMLYVSRSIWAANCRAHNNPHKLAVGIMNRNHDVDMFYPPSTISNTNLSDPTRIS